MGALRVTAALCLLSLSACLGSPAGHGDGPVGAAKQADGDGPDLVVSSVTGSPSAIPGGPLSATVTVCNQGTEPSPITEVDAYLSTDATITTDDVAVGAALVDYLDVGQCETVTVNGYADVPADVYTLGAIVDPWNWVPELIETNNATAGGLTGVGFGPDLVVSSVSGPSAAIPGGPLATTVTVCNQGTEPAPGVEVDAYLSADDAIGTDDFDAGSAWVSPLDAGACATVTVNGDAGVAPGVYTLGAIVDPQNAVPELIETNNATAGGAIGVGFAPDLVVSSVSGSPSAIPGGSLATTVTVCNQGTAPSPGAQVDAYLSADGTITTGDFDTGSTTWVSPLDVGACATVALTGWANAPEGVYTLGAIVDPQDQVQELLESNNATAGPVIGVGWGPDLVVQSISGPPSVLPNSPLPLSITVCNQGTEPSQGAQVDAYLSADAIITTMDTAVGGAWVDGLGVGQCETVTANGFSPGYWLSQGAYTLGAIVDPWNWVPELIESNNATAGGLIGFGNGPDLVVSSVSGSASVTPGGSFAATVTVCNQGTAPSPGAEVDVYLSADATITPADFDAGSAFTGSLNAGQCTTVTVPCNAGVAPGAYTVGAIVDPQNWVPELIENNNATAGTAVGVGWGPDLVVSQVGGPPSVIPGGSLATTVTVCNQGTAPSPGVQVDAYLSVDATITTSDFDTGSTTWVSPLDVGACTTVTLTGWANAPQGVYTLGAIVDPQDQVQELLESNNATAGPVIGVGWGPDLVVQSISGPPSVSPNSPLPLSITVCNQGTEPSPGTQVTVYLSADATITQTDTVLGGASVDGLGAGQCETVAANGFSPGYWLSQGAYTLGAIVDPWNWVPELIETNNATAGGLIGFGNGPDLVVSSVSGSPSVIPGGSFAATVTVCNQGTAPSPGAEVDVYLSADATITTADFDAGSAFVSFLNAGQCTTVTVNGSAGVPPGAYTLGAIVDPQNWVPELIESNNATAGTAIGVGWGPDLVVSSVSGPPSVIPGGSLASTVTVCNQGTAPSPGVQVDAYLSVDATITTSDFDTGSTTWVNPLDAGACATVTLMGWANAPQGVYSLGAIVDPQNQVQELLESNNATAGGLVGVGWGPDLVVSSISGPPSVLPNSPLPLSITVCNQGTEPSPGTQVNAYLSADATITPMDTAVGGATVDGLGAGQCETVTVNGYSPGYWLSQGAYTLGAIVDPMNWVPELIETNNTTAGGLVGFGNGPDLVVSSVSGSPSVTSGGSFAATVTVCNQGTVTSPSAQVDVYLSADATITTADFDAGSIFTNWLDAGACTTVTVPCNAGVPPGPYTVGAIVDPQNWVPELIDSNNAAAGTAIGVGWGPDLVVSSVSGPPSVIPGGSLATTVTVCNQGTAPSPGAQVNAYLSVDATITTSDFDTGSTTWVNPLDAGACATVTLTGWANAPQGVYTLGAIVDPQNQVQELLESNNATAGGLVGVGWGPDLVVSSISGPSSVLPNSPLPLSITVCNQGTEPSPGTQVNAYLSADATITPMDTAVGGATVNGLGAGQCETVTVNGYSPGYWLSQGAYTLGAIVDPWSWVPELIETNNATAGGLIGFGNAPDLVVSSVTGSPSAIPNGVFTVTITVCNQGTDASFGAQVSAYLSTDASITTADVDIGDVFLGLLDAGECTTLTGNANAGVPPGAYTVGAIVDPQNQVRELIETNNATAGTTIGVGYGPDLVVSQVGGQPSAVPGGPRATTVTVCNQGTAPSPAVPVNAYLSADATITTGDFDTGSTTWVSPLDAGACATVTLDGWANAPQGVYTVGAIVDPQNRVQELLEGNNATAGGLVGVGWGPDLVVQSISGPPSVSPNSPFTLSITVCNQGTTPSQGTQVNAYLSADATITQADTGLGGASVDPLDAGACETVTVNGFSPGYWLQQGAYTLGAIVDPQNWVPELIETNNATAGTVIGFGYGPDFVVTSVSGPSSVSSGGPFAASITVCNQGTGASPGVQVDAYLSTDATLTTSDFDAGSAFTDFLDVGACATVTVNGNASVPPGAYTLGAIVDPQNQVRELIESNNATPGGSLSVGP
jgi:subtilase family serine protease